MSNDMRIRALAPWFGCKRTLASRIIAEFGPHDCYWDTMCGGCGVVLAKEPTKAETVNDVHGWLTRLARTLCDITKAKEIYRRCSQAIACENLWKQAVANIKNHDPDCVKNDVVVCCSYLYASWLARNGYGGTSDWASAFGARFSATGGATSRRWASVVESIPAWHERLKNVTILNRDALEVIARINDADGTVIYCDPPYIQEGERYEHTFGTVGHATLRVLLGRFKKARVVISYYNDQLLDTLYEGWTKIELPTPKFLVKAGQREADGECPMAPEVLLINGPSLVCDSPLFREEK